MRTEGQRLSWLTSQDDDGRRDARPLQLPA
jgi:hypothetical protein